MKPICVGREMRNFPPSFSFFLIFHEFSQAEKQERLLRLRESIIQLMSLKIEEEQEELA
jgi:hypothetical protein